MYGNDFLWSVYEPCAGDVASRMRAYAVQIQAGPVEDAVRQGIQIQKTGGIAVIPMMGLMVRRVHPLIGELFGLTSTDAVRQAIIAADQDEDVENIIVRADTPGGSVSGLNELADTIENAKTPIIFQVEGMLASAGYYVAAAADEIVVGKTDLIGSIGTRMMLYDFSKAFEAEGIEAVPIDTGEFKSAGAMGTEITENQRAEFQRIVDFYFDDFVKTVAEGRNITERGVRDVADGRMYTPDEALQYNLIDGVATIEDTLARLRDNTGRSTDSARARMRLHK